MNLSDAVKALKEGKKVRLHGWGKKSYIKIVGEEIKEVKFYNEATNYLSYDTTTLLSEEWYSVGDEENKYNFPDMLNQIRSGKSCRREEWEEDKYVVFDKQSGIVVKQMEEIPNFVINFDSLILENWEVVGEGQDDIS